MTDDNLAGAVMKRQILPGWKEIVNLVNDKKQRLTLIQILVYFRAPTSKFYLMLTDVMPFIKYDHSDRYMDTLIPIITDIYFDNYELQHFKYMYRLIGINSSKGPLYLSYKDDCYKLNEYWYCDSEYQELTDDEFQEFLNQYSKFTADMFEKMEV